MLHNNNSEGSKNSEYSINPGLTEKLRLSRLFIQYLVLDKDCCISRNVGRNKTNLVTSNTYIFYILIYMELELSK